jgi:hypothetical protein
MPLGLIFWIIMLLWLIFALMWNWPGRPTFAYYAVGNTLMLFVLFVLLGWRVFGAAIQG